MCQQIVAITSRDGKTVYVGTGSHTALASKHKINLRSTTSSGYLYKWIAYESDALRDGPMKLDKSGRRRSGAKFVCTSWGTRTKAADKATKEAFAKILGSPEGMREHISKHGLDDYSKDALFSNAGVDMVNNILGTPVNRSRVIDENYRLKRKVASQKATATLVSLKARRDKRVYVMIDEINTDLAKRHPKYKPTLEFSISIQAIEASGRELAEYGFMTIPEVKSLVDSIKRYLSGMAVKISSASYKVKYPNVNYPSYSASKGYSGDKNKVWAMVFSQPEFRTPKWR